MKSKIIFLNGCSSAGKTSLVKALQHLSEDFWLTFGIDDIIDAMPRKYIGVGEKANQGFHFVSSVDKEAFPITEIKVGPIGEKLRNFSPKIVRQLVEKDWLEPSKPQELSIKNKIRAFFYSFSCSAWYRYNLWLFLCFLLQN